MKKYFISGIISAVISIISVFFAYNYWPVGGIDLLRNEEMLGSTITTIASSDTLKNSRAVINTNFSNLNDGKIENSTTSVSSITTLPNLTSVASLASLPAFTITKGYFLIGNDSGINQATSTAFMSSTGKFGIGSTTPFAQLSVGAGGNASSTISTGKFCMLARQENGVQVYLVLGANQPNGQPFATTSVSCL